MRWLLLCASLFAPTVLALSASAQLAQQLAALHSMQASFNQVTLPLKKNQPAQTAAGTMAWQRPAKFRWEMQRPVQQYLIASGKTLWIYNVALQQAIKQPLSAAVISPAAVLSGDIGELQKRFTVQQLPSGWYQLTPRHANDLLAWIKLQFVRGSLTRMQIKNQLDQVTDFQFSDIRINPVIAASVFKFAPPAGVDVIQQ